MTDTPSGLPLFDFPQLNGEFKANALIWRQELMWTGIVDRDLATPPGSPAFGDAYLVGTPADGAWTGHDGDFAQWHSGAWNFTSPTEGNIVRVNDENAVIHYNGASWAVL